MEECYLNLCDSWKRGDRDRERALQLLFLSWMHWADPPFVTGMSNDPHANELWHEIFDFFGGEKSSDQEFLHVAGMMLDLFPEVHGDSTRWEAVAKRLKARSLELQPDGFSAELFEGRSHYGEYFAHQARHQSS